MICVPKAAVLFHSSPHHLFPLWDLVLPCIPADPEVRDKMEKFTKKKSYGGSYSNSAMLLHV